MRYNVRALVGPLSSAEEPATRRLLVSGVALSAVIGFTLLEQLEAVCDKASKLLRWRFPQSVIRATQRARW